MTSKQARDYLRVFLSGASAEIPDKQNRVTIPPTLRSYAGLDRDLVVIGAGSRAEIWDAEAWETYLAEQEAAFANTDGGGDPGTLLSVPGAGLPAIRPDTTSPVPGRNGWGSGTRGSDRPDQS